jgi:Na+/H+ antiporter NhaD/arsenite permease-like protein
MNINANNIQAVATILFAIAVIHTFLTKPIKDYASRFKGDSIRGRTLKCLGEVELIFGFWAAVLLMFYAYFKGFMLETEHIGTVYYLEKQNFTEPIFVFIIMCIVSTRPITYIIQKVILKISEILPLQRKKAVYITVLIIGPILGSFITEPAAMAITALILLKFFYRREMSEKFKYATLAILFVNISIGGTLTNFSAPPIIMVASKWNWHITDMITKFGYKSVIAIVISTVLVATIFKKELRGKIEIAKPKKDKKHPPFWLSLFHLIFLAYTVYLAHHTTALVAAFLFFIGLTHITKKYQTDIKYKEAFLVSFFLAGLVTLGSLQSWWLKPILTNLNDTAMYFSTTILTSFTDNAALAYLGSLVELTETAKYNLIAGALTGGGLTVIANAPNPAGYSILKASFNKGINPFILMRYAIIPTLITIVAFKFLPSI